MFCENCGTEINGTVRFCPGCGAKVEQKPDSSVCPACGAPVKPGAKFCEDCGAKVVNAANQQEEISVNTTPAYNQNGPSTSNFCANSENRNHSKSSVILIAGFAAIAVIAAIAIFFSKGKKEEQVVLENSKERQEVHSDEDTSGASPNVDISDQSIDNNYVDSDSVLTDQTKDDTADQGYTALTDMDSIAADLSTTEEANAADFVWFLDYILYGGEYEGQVIKDSTYTTQITGDKQQLLNGGWKAYMFFEDNGSYTPDGERYFNADINTSGENFTITMNWKYYFDGYSDKTIEETGSDIFEGNWNGADGTALVYSNFAMVNFDGFFMNADGTAEYAIGTFDWTSGERCRIGLVRIHEF